MGVACAILLLVEFMQIFVVARYSGTGDVLLGLVGALIGRRAYFQYVRNTGQLLPVAADSSLRELALSLAILAVYALFLLCVFWVPFNFTDDRQHLKLSYQSLWVAPFAKLYIGSEFNALSQVMAKMGFFLPLGVLFSWRMHGIRPTFCFGLAGLVAIAIGLLIELGQIFLPGKYPDFTDILFYLIGILVGVWLGMAFMAWQESKVISQE